MFRFRPGQFLRPFRPLFRPVLLRRLVRGFFFAALALVIVWGAYACAGAATLRREIRDTPRDPETGVVLGTEALALDPPAGHDAPTSACLLIHGFVGSRKDFADLGQRLAAAGFHVELMRLPGHGATPPEFRAQTPESLLAAVTTQFRALKSRYRAVHVIGFSMGGSLATLLASREPVSRLVLAAPYYGVTWRWFYILPAEAWNAALSPLIPYVIKSERFVQVNRREAAKEIFSYHSVPTRGAATLMTLGRQARQPATLDAIHSPVLLVMSPTDGAASPARARAAFAGLKNAAKQAHWLDPRNNHHIFWDYDNEEAKQAIVEFLSK